LKWLEVSLQVDEELAEPVAEVLGRHASGGVALSQADPDQPLVDIRGYLSADTQTQAVREKLERDLWFLGRIRPLPSPAYTWLEDADWAEAWKANFKPLLIGQRLRIQPAWLASPPDDRIAILIDPGMAFGTGAHPTTQLCLELIESLVRPGDWIADLGCGSGILSIAAVRLGAAGSLAFDSDPQAVDVCRENARVNGTAGQISVGVGSLPDLLARVEQPPFPRWAVANIYLSVLVEMLGQGLGRLCRPEGGLILSGILEEQESELVKAAEKEGLRVVDTRARAEWRALVLKGNKSAP
jgi:ribosomal protein L11 methyltransferase